MKKILMATAISLALASAAHADNTALLKVTGLLSNAACTPELTNGGVVDFGRINLQGLSQTDTNQFNAKEITLNINCTSSAKAAWTISDDRADTHPGASVITIANADDTGASVSDTTFTYGLGNTAGGVGIGAYSVSASVANVMADGANADAIYTTVGSDVWQTSTTGMIKNGNAEMMTVAAKGTTEPVSYTTARFPLYVKIAIQGTDALAITDDTDLDGQATITLKYL